MLEKERTCGGGRAFGYEAELKMFDDFIDGFVIFDESDNVHLSSAGKTEQWIHFKNWFCVLFSDKITAWIKEVVSRTKAF
jgi:hypothetical protein